MPKPTKFNIAKDGKSWRINIPAAYASEGRRERHFFKTREDALKKQKELRNDARKFGEKALTLSPTLAEQAVQAEALLKPYGISILEAASRIAAIERERIASTSIEKALDAFIADKIKLSDKQRQAIRHMANHLREDFSGRIMATIACDEIEDHLKTRTSGDSAYNAKIRLLTTFWRWCAIPKRGWCQGDIFKHAERKTVVTEEIGVLTSSDAEKLLRAAETHFSDMVPVLAIALFTGMRQAEIERLTTSDISQEGITVPAVSAKTKKRRFIQMTEPLAAWLEAYPVEGELVPANYERKEKAVRRLAGWRVWSDLAADRGLGDAEPPEDSPQWPQNALRHTAASLNLALGRPIETLVFEHGHSGGLQMLRTHYIGKITKADALKIWALRPLKKISGEEAKTA